MEVFAFDLRGAGLRLGLLLVDVSHRVIEAVHVLGHHQGHRVNI